MSSTPCIAEVLVDLGIERPLDYLIPKEWEGRVRVGSRVEIPVRSKPTLGFVTKIKSESAFANLKPFLRLADEEIISSELFQLALWMKDYYLCPLKKILKTMLPGSVRKEKKEKTQYFVQRNKTLDELSDSARQLREKGSLQANVLDVMLKAKKGILLSELLEKAACSRSVVDALVKKGLLLLDIVRVDRSPLINEEYFRTNPKPLNGDQRQAFQNIVDSLDKNEFKVHLLWGVTGSGKTEVYLQAIDHVLKQGKGAIMLVPEISLTEQTIERLRSRFEGQIAILHHRLSEGEKLDEWQRIRRGEAPIVVGARSSVFSPLPKVGLLIIDEEHEGSYKQSDESPRYHAKEVAIMRAKFANATVILGSATPSLESFYNARQGKYLLAELKGRADSQNMPKVKIVDMKKEFDKRGGFTLFSDPLLEAIKHRLERGEQTILLLNRRGWHACMKCQGCGEAVKCLHCDVTLTFHKGEKQLACHLCGYHIAPPTACPTCKGASPLKFKGCGTEQAEAALKAILPEVRTLRMDADTTRHKGSHSRLFRDFGRGKADVLIGTQMIAKGLHFPEVTLVGVLSCDMSLNVPDFRASETSFQLLTQVAGRAGRGGRPGEVLFQTMLPQHPTILLAASQNYSAFFEEESETRKLFGYPPYGHLVKIGASSTVERGAFDTLEKLRKELSCHLSDDYEILPALPAGHAKVKDHFRFHFLLKGPQLPPLLRTLAPLVPKYSDLKGVKISIDVNPLSTFF